MCDYKLLHGLDFFLGMNHIKFFFSDVLVSFYFIDFLESCPLLRDLMPPLFLEIRKSFIYKLIFRDVYFKNIF